MRSLLGLILATALVSVSSFAQQPHVSLIPEFMPCAPESDDSDEVRDGMGRPIPELARVSADFCSEWNPEFFFNGHHCCSKILRASGSKRRRRLPAKVCSRDRFKPNFCGDMTPEQRSYVDGVSGGKIADVLAVIDQEMGRKGDQAYCTVNNGFLAHGRPIVPTSTNRVRIRMPERCTNYGTDHMVGLLEWTGRAIAQEYADPKFSQLNFVVGDISAPRGGCLAGRTGPKGHASHTNGQDADIGFLLPRAGRSSPDNFHTDFDAKANWWLIKKILRNPYACVKVIFLDKRLIRKLGKAARGDEEWEHLWRYIRHVPGHRNHLHVRIGDGPGAPGCKPGANPEDELEDNEGIEETVDLEAMDLMPNVNGPRPASTSLNLNGQ